MIEYVAKKKLNETQWKRYEIDYLTINNPLWVQGHDAMRTMKDSFFSVNRTIEYIFIEQLKNSVVVATVNKGNIKTNKVRSFISHEKGTQVYITSCSTVNASRLWKIMLHNHRRKLHRTVTDLFITEFLIASCDNCRSWSQWWLNEYWCEWIIEANDRHT